MSETPIRSTPSIRKRGVCFIISAPSGAGKSTIANALRASQTNLIPSVSVTTRKPRPGEVNGVHYHFITKQQFKEQSETGQLIEWATVFDNGYGTPKAPIEEELAKGNNLIFDIDWQGHQQIRQALPKDVVGIFILPPSMEELKRRLQTRASDDPQEINKRMAAALDEISHWKEFDYVIINNKLDIAITEAECVLKSEKLKTNRQLSLNCFTNTFSK